MESYCQACLSNDRTLYPLVEMQLLLDNINLSEMKHIQGGICWECKGMMKRFWRFRDQVQRAQSTFHSYFKMQTMKCLSKLSYSSNSDYNYEFSYKYDPLTESKTVPDIKVKEETYVYEETYANDDEKYSDIDEKAINKLFNDGKPPIDNSDVFVQILNSNTKINIKKPKKRPKRIKKVKESEVDEEELREKFTTVVFTEEEMLKNREEKRNQPNFKKIPYKCDTCVLGFTRKDTYNLHMEKKHDKNIGDHICPVCQSIFPSEKQVDRHKKKHYVCYRCRLCRYETLELWSALSHCQLKHDGDSCESIHCPYCELVAKTPEELSQHINTNHGVVCNECGEKFKGLSTLRSHKRRIHTIKREFICDICSKTFKTKSRLESHMSAHNSSLARTLAYCAACRVQYKNIHVYRNHLRTSARHADPERRYQCRECNKKFASKVYWKKHYNFYHLHKSQFHCELCNKLFISDWRLKNHRQTQHGLSRSRDHHCNICGKQFYTLSTLRGHQLTHSEQRTFMCEDCGDTFKQRPALYTHYRLVHKGIKRAKKI